jgi:hypothetical protein
MDLVGAFSAAVDHYVRQRGGRTDLGEMAQMAAAESLFAVVGQTLPSLYDRKREEVERRPLLRSQALGEAFGPGQLEGVARYEVHLDRKLERMLAILLKLKELRVPAQPTRSVSQNA